ncbi:MAG: Crp/Fnr family transcriptional regulator [Bacteroidetes bacterium]|nr:Crp/Fnr family transcriptional regulator [Bacteroidota bacterium]
MEKYWSLEKINVYEILCPPKIKKESENIGKRYSKEEVVYFEENSDDNVYLVSNGKVKLVTYDNEGNEIIKQIITKGGLFGEKLLLNESVRKEFAVSCTNQTTICSMNIKNMKKLMRDNENFSTAVYKFIGFKFAKIERRLELLVGKDVTTRIASYIYDMYKETNQLTISQNLSQKEIGSLLGTSRESVAKIFNQLKSQNIIEYNRKKIIIKNLAGLRELSSG